MRKKVFSILTALSLALSMLPLSVMAKTPQPMTTTIDGKTYQLGEDISTSTINLSTTTTSVFTYYTAGEGYVLWEPTVEDENVTSGTMTLHNASIEKNVAAPLITLPEVDVNIILEGDNSLINDLSGYEDTTGIQQGEIVGANDAIPDKNYSLIFMGEGSLSLDSGQCDSIYTDGTLIFNSGTLTTSSLSGIVATDFEMNGGTLNLNGGFNFFRNAVINGGALYNNGGSGKSMGMCNGNFTVTGGDVECGAGLMGAGIICYGTISHTGGIFNATVLTSDASASTITLTAYGDTALESLDNNDPVDAAVGVNSGMSYMLSIPSGNTLTIPSGARLITTSMDGQSLTGVTAETIGNYIKNDGTLVNNGTIFLAPDTSAEDVKIIADTIKATGNGTIQVYDEVGSGANNIVYNNSGVIINILDELDLSSQTEETSGNGYTWAGNVTDGYTLTLESVSITNNLYLPTNTPITIVTNTDSTISGGINFSGDYGDNITFKGDATLNIDSINANGSPENSVIVDGTKLNVKDMINIYGSGNDGNKELFKVINGAEVECENSVICSTIIVSGNSQLTSHSDSCAVMANVNGGNGGNVTITDNSTLTTNCDYGVYIIDGKLTVDDTSKLITNASVAPFCIVDTSNSKILSDIISLPGLPNGIEYACAKSITPEYTFWSVVSTGDTLSVTNANSEPADLNGAVKGKLTFSKLVVYVTSITGIPTTATASKDLTFSGIVNPSNAENQTIIWSVKDAGTTGATITGNTLSTKASGSVKVTATITNGKSSSTDYTQDFEITITSPSSSNDSSSTDDTDNNSTDDTDNSSTDVTTTEAPKTEITQPEVTPETSEEKPANNPKTGNTAVSLSLILGFILISGIIAVNIKSSFKQNNK